MANRPPIIKDSPLLLRGGFSNAVYVVTKWRDHGEGRVEALEKFDVTEQFDHLVANPDINQNRTTATPEPITEEGGTT